MELTIGYKRITAATPLLLYCILTIHIVLTGCGQAAETATEDHESIYFKDYDPPKNKWGYINTDGDLVIQARYDAVSRFSGGMAAVNYQGKWGYIDSHGTPLTGFDYKSAWPMSEGVGRALNFDGSWTLVFSDGRSIHLDSIQEVYSASGGYLRFEKGFRTGFLDLSGLQVIEPRFEQAWDFSEHMARVKLNEKYGLIDSEGNFILEPEYDRLDYPSEGWVPIKQGNFYSYIHLATGRKLTGDWTDAGRFHNASASVASSGAAWLIDTTGQKISDTFASLRYAGEGLWVCKKGSRFAVTDGGGNVLCPFKYNQINNYSEGFAAYQENGYWGYLDTDGNAFTPPQFGLAWDFQGGFARAAFSNGIAYIDTSGKVPFIPGFQELNDFYEGLAGVQEW